MKKTLLFLLTVAVLLSFCTTVFAQENQETKTDSSQPRLMVTSYTIDGDFISPSQSTNLKVTFKNFSTNKTISNIKLSILDESGEIKADGMSTQFVNKINANGTYTWNIPLIASKTSKIGEHKLTVAMEYEDTDFTPFSTTDIISINVKQSVGIDYSGVQLPVKVSQENTETVTVSIMNTGKSNVRNCKVDFNIAGLDNGGTLFIGEIPVGENKSGSANLRVSSTMLGETKGIATISYEDEFGESYSETIELATKIEEKIEKTDDEIDKEQKKNTLWWLFIIIGIVIGGGIGSAIPILIYSNKQRKEDEMRL